VKGPPSSSFRDKVTKRRSGKERVEWGRGPWRAVLAFLPKSPQVPSYATDCGWYSFIPQGPDWPIITLSRKKRPVLRWQPTYSIH